MREPHPLTRVRRIAVDLARALVPPGPAGRRLGAMTVTQAVGAGAFLSASPVLLTTAVGVTPARLALALSLAGVAGLVVGPVIGRWADRSGAGRLLAASHLGAGLCYASYAAAHDVLSLSLAASGVAVCEAAGSPLRGAITVALFGAGQAARVRAQVRTLFNVGFSAGGGLGAVALGIGTRSAYLAVALGAGTCHLGCALLARQLPIADTVRAGHVARRRWTALRDRGFVGVTVLSGLLEMFQPILTIGLPLWAVHRLHAPPPLAAAPATVNAVLVVLLQTRATRGADTTAGSAELLARSGALLTTACLVLAASSFTVGAGSSAGPIVAAALLLLGTAVLTAGEVLQAAGAWGLSSTLAPAARAGEYQGVFALGRGLSQIAGPTLVTVLLLRGGTGGWIVLAALFASAGATVRTMFPPAADKPRGPAHLP